MVRIYCVLIGYVFGLFQTAYFYGRMKGVDIRKVGNGNAGATNTLRELGTKAGLIVLAGDILKTMAAILIVKLLFRNSYPNMIYLLILYTAMGAILGHNYPFYLKFKGGKGIAATAGLILSFHPTFIIVGVTLFFGSFLSTNYVSLGSLLVYAGFMIQLVLSGQMGLFPNMTQGNLNEMYVIGLILTIMAYWRHRANIKRLLTGTERKTYLFKKKEEK